MGRALIRVVSFDLEGTLVDMTFSNKVWNEGLPKLYALKVGVSFDEAKKAVLNEYARVGESCVEWYDICYWFRHFGLSDNPRHLIDLYKGYICPFPDVMEVLKKLSQKYRLIIITNSHRLFVEALTCPMTRYFEHVFSTTSEFGLLKGNPDTYRRVCEAINVAPHEVAHVGDRVHDDFESPRSVGVNAYLLDREGKCMHIPVQYKVKNLQEFAELLISGKIS